MYEVFKVKLHNNYYFLSNTSEKKNLEENIKLNWQVLLI